MGTWQKRFDPFACLPFYPFTACGNKEKEYDATGTFEATETTMYAEQSGTLLTFSVNEGDNINQGQEVGLIDTTQIWLKIQQAKATKEVYQSQKPDMEAQIAATRQQLAKAKQDQRRYQELVADGAAPSKMLDDAASQVKVLQKQLDAQVLSTQHQHSTLNSQQAHRRRAGEPAARPAQQMPRSGTHQRQRTREICGAGRVRDHRQAVAESG